MAILKIIVGGSLIWLITELGKRSGKIGGLILSLPLTSLIALFWLWLETHDAGKVSSVAKEGLIFILPSLVFFISLPLLLEKQIHFYLSFALSTLLTLVSYWVFYKMRGV